MAFGERHMLHILEYGKYCKDDPETSVENGADYQILGYSEGFPKVLLQVCNPSTRELNPCLNRFGDDYSLGYVVRTYVYQKVRYRILCISRLRPESGRSNSGRSYWVLRYIVSENLSFSISSMIQTGLSRPLDGIKRTFQSPQCINLPKPLPSVYPLSYEKYPNIIDKSIEYISQGLTINIYGYVDHTWFMSYCEQLLRVFPRIIGIYIGFAWKSDNEQYNSSLAVITSDVPVAHAANFDVINNTWLLPSETQAQNSSRSHRSTPSPYSRYITKHHSKKGSVSSLDNLIKYLILSTNQWPSLADSNFLPTMNIIHRATLDLEKIDMLLKSAHILAKANNISKEVFQLDDSAGLLLHSVDEEKHS